MNKENAGAVLLDTCREMTGSNPVPIGTYRGFTMLVNFDAINKKYELVLRGEMSHKAVLGSDARGNLIRIENVLDQMPQRLASVQAQLDNLYQQRDAAQREAEKPFPFEKEFQEKTARLTELDMELNIDKRSQSRVRREGGAVAKSEKPSVLDKLKQKPIREAMGKNHKKEMEVR